MTNDKKRDEDERDKAAPKPQPDPLAQPPGNPQAPNPESAPGGDVTGQPRED